MEQLKIGFVGVGNMASAILNGVLSAGVITPEQVGLFDISADSMERFTQRRCMAFSSISELVRHCAMVVLAVKPQQFSDILPQVKAGIREETTLVSIAAGITPERIRAEMGFNCKLVLAMPNTPLLVGSGATALARVEPTPIEDFNQVKAVFETAGLVEEIPVNKMNDSMPIHGSSPAFLYEFARIVANCAKNVGIEEDIALRLFAQTLVGSGKMILESGKKPQELINMVCSPGGATLAGMAALEDSGYEQAVENAFHATIWRGTQMANTNPLRDDVDVSVVEYGEEAYQEAKELRRRVLREPLGLGILEADNIGDVTAIHLCARMNGKVVGTCQLKKIDDTTVKMGQVAVDPTLQKSGIGAMLLWMGDKIAAEQGHTQMILDSRMTAKAFYLRQGFQSMGDIFLIHGIPHIAMRKILPKS